MNKKLNEYNLTKAVFLRLSQNSFEVTPMFADYFSVKEHGLQFIKHSLGT